MDATNLYGHSMSQLLPYDENKFDKIVKVEDIINTPDDNDIGYFIDVDLTCPDNLKGEPKNFLFCLENKVIHNDKYNDYMNKIKPKIYIKAKKLIYDWTDKKNFLIRYRMLKFFVRHGMVVE